jgi:hypothetical protein
MSGEIKPLFSKEAEKQLELIEKQMIEIHGVIDTLSKQKIDFKSIKDYTKAVDEQKKSVEKLSAEEKKLLAATERLKFAQSDSAKEVARLNEQTIKQNKENKEAAKSVLKLETEYQKFKKAVIQAQTEAKELGVVLGKNSPEFIKAAAAADKLKRELREIDMATGDTSSNVGNYAESLASLVPGFEKVNGALQGIGINLSDIAANNQGAKAFFADLGSGLTDITKKALAFIASPIGLAIAGLAAITLATKAFLDFNSEIAKTNLEVEQLANTSGAATDKLREQATAISKAYGKDFKDAVKEIASIQKDFGVSADEAFKIYNKGLAEGGANSVDFGDSIREYGVLFSQAGFSATEFIDLLNKGIDLGIYTDKLPDAIKEAGISLNEQTKATRDALVNAFGASFADDILDKVKSGEISVKEALLSISSEAKTAQLNQQQLAQLTADVFRGAGEDAGGAALIFQVLNGEIEGSTKGLTDLQKQQQKSAELFKEIEEAKTEAFKSDTAIAFTNSVKNLWLELKLRLLKEIGSIINSFGKLYKLIFDVKIAFVALKDGSISFAKEFIAVFKNFDITKPFESLKNSFKGLVDAAKKTGQEINDAINLKGSDKVKEKELVDRKRKNGGSKSSRPLEDVVSVSDEDLDETTNKIEKHQFDISAVIQEAAMRNAKILATEQDRISQEFRDGAISAEEFIQQIADAQKVANNNTITDTIAALQKSLELKDLEADEIKEIQESLYDFEYQLRQENLASVQDEANKQIEIEREKASQLKAIRDKERAERLTTAKSEADELAKIEAEKEALIESVKFSIRDAGFMAISELANRYFEQETEKRNEQLTQIQNEESAKLAYIQELQSQGAISAEVAEARRLRAIQEADKQEAALKRKQAIQDKAQAIFNIGLSTAQAIMSALAMTPPNIPLSISAGITGAVQLGLAASKPIPKFAKGTKSSPEGLAIFGEAGTELLTYPTGEQFLATKETLGYLPKGTEIKNAKETKEYLSNNDLTSEIKGLRKDFRRKNLSVNVNVSNNSRINYLGL